MKNHERILVTGSRGYPRDRVWQVLNDWVSWGRFEKPLGEIVIVHGACPNSPDQWANSWAIENGHIVAAFKADWERFGKRAGPIRNSTMIASGVNLVFAFWDAKSRGTKDTIDKALAAGLEVRIFPPERVVDLLGVGG